MKKRHKTKSRNRRTKHAPGKKNLRIIPLGGQEEVGRNMTIFEYGRDIVIIDMGMQFPEEDMPGIDYIIPNLEYLKGKEKRIRAVIFTHGHLDHIGAAPIGLEKLGYPPIIGRPLTLALIKNRMEDYKKGSSQQQKTLTIQSYTNTFKLGSFTLQFFKVDHSIIDSAGIILKTPAGSIIHPGDWTYEKKPVGRKPITYRHLAKLPKPSILMLESLGATSTRPRIPERTMYHNLEKLVREAPSRVILATFSSQLERVKQIIEFASKINKKVALDGYSMRLNVQTAKELGYIKANKKTLIGIHDIHKYPPKRVVVLCTGAQGEGNAVLSRIVSGNHKFIKMKKEDTVIFSSSVIPGNERVIQRLKDNVYRLSDHVYHTDVLDVHSGGHSNAEDIIEVLKQTRPTYFLPVYAHHYMLKEAANLAVSTGFKRKNIFILDNGSVFSLQKGAPKILPKKIPSSYVFIDGLGVGDVSNVVLRDRQMLAEDGIFVVIVTLNGETGRLEEDPEIITRGFIYQKESGELINRVKGKVKQIVQDKEPRTKAVDVYIKNKIRDKIGQFLFSKTERRPMVIPVVIEV